MAKNKTNRTPSLSMSGAVIEDPHSEIDMTAAVG